MRISLVLLFCLLIVVVNSATTKKTTRRVVVTTRRGVTKAPVRKSAYDYLRTVRGKNSCAGGTCPFWERHGRSFVSLRCYAQQYQECTCLHRMCFRSCIFTRAVCNQEMVSCLQQICPRCMPASALAMCAVYSSVAQQVAVALSTFACYQCCPVLNNNTNGQAMMTPSVSNTGQLAGSVPGAGSANSVNGVSQNGALRPTNGGNSGSIQSVNGNQGYANGNNNNLAGVVPGNGMTNSNNNNVNSGPVRSQQVKQNVRVVTTRRTSATTRRAVTVRAPAQG